MRRNYLLFMPSLITRNDPPRIAYRSEDTDEVYYGCQTNIPASMLVLDKLTARSEKLDGIIMLCSDEVLNNKVSIENKLQTTYEYYLETVSAKMSELGYSKGEIDAAFAPFSLSEINPGSWSSMDKVQNEMLRLINSNYDASADGTTLFVDYTGGLRSASMLLVFFSKLLESQGVTVDDVFYSNISRVDPKTGLGEGKIESCMDTYHIFDYLHAFATESLDELGHMFSQDENNKDFSLLIQQTKEAQKRNRRGKYSEITEADREAVSITEKMDILQRIAAGQINDIRRSLTPENAIRELVKGKDIERAIQRIKEGGLRMLIKKRIITWRSTYFNTDEKKKDAFYAYVRYYRSYLDFVCEMLLNLDLSKEPDELWKDYIDYTIDQYVLWPLPEPRGSITPAFEEEFDKRYPDVVKELRDLLVSSIKEHHKDDDMIVQIVDEYIYDKKRFISAYLNGGKGGFPFANILSGWSYSRLSKDKYGWYADKYKTSLDASMKPVCSLSADERKIVQEFAANDISLLAQVFPPIKCNTLFTVSNDSTALFGEKVLLMDSIRMGRNLFTHAGEKTTANDEARMNRLILKFLNWIDGGNDSVC